MIREETKELSGDIVVKVRQFEPLTALRWVTLLLPAIGAALAPALDVKNPAGDFDFGKVDFRAVRDSLTPEMTREFALALGKQTECSYTTVSGARVDGQILDKAASVELAFQGQIGAMLEWILFGLMLNFADFLGSLPSPASTNANEATTNQSP